MKKKLICFSVILFICWVGLFQCQRKKTTPIIKTKPIFIKGKETISSIQQKLNPTVKKRLQPYLSKAGFDTYPKRIIFLIFKEEQKLELLGFQNNSFKKIKSYDFTAFSGKIGPKLKEGDRQIPEGIYKIEFLNPNSSYHLSLKVNYPNQFDKKKAKLDNRTNLGGDIFIHGKNVTIGCVPVGDEAIEELFIISKFAFNKGIRVVIAPKDFRKNTLFPNINSITWENELYQNISEELKNINLEKRHPNTRSY